MKKSEEHIRTKLRKGTVKPTPEGVLVVGRIKGLDTPVRSWCRNHIFETDKPIKNPMWQSGWHQGAWCLVCDDYIPPIDASWWIKKAKAKDIRRVMKHLKKEARRYGTVYNSLKRRLSNYEEDE